MAGEMGARQKRRVAVAGEGVDPFMFKVILKSGPRGCDEQLDGPVRMLLSSEKYPALRSLSVGPAIKSWMEKVATAMVGELRLTGNTALGLFRESGTLEK